MSAKTKGNIMIYIANLGTDNAAWLATPGATGTDAKLATDLGDGRVEITGRALSVLSGLSEDLDGSITDDEHGIQIWIEGTGYALAPAYTIADAALELDVTPDAIQVLADQISDDAELWDDVTNTLTPAGMDLIRDSINTENPTDQTMDELAEAADAYRDAYDALDDARARRDAAIRAAVRYGHPKSRVAAAADISREMLYRIIG
jgi:hypothetical protein